MRDFRFSSVLALLVGVGFAGSASGSATLDLLWGSPQGSTSIDLGSVPSGSASLFVVLTAGSEGSLGGGVSVNYGDAFEPGAVLEIVNNPNGSDAGAPLPVVLIDPTDNGSRVRSVNAVAAPFVGLGRPLDPGESWVLAEIRFDQSLAKPGNHELAFELVGPDDLLDGIGYVISGTTQYNPATVTRAPQVGAELTNQIGVWGFCENQTTGEVVGGFIYPERTVRCESLGLGVTTGDTVTAISVGVFDQAVGSPIGTELTGQSGAWGFCQNQNTGQTVGAYLLPNFPNTTLDCGSLGFVASPADVITVISVGVAN